MITIPAGNVTSPKDCVSNIRVIYDGKDGSLPGTHPFSLALLDWEGKTCFAIRWNVAQREWDDPQKNSNNRTCAGMPTSRGYPVWFILPDEIIKQDSKIWSLIRDAKYT
jgi:hypothetical protein